MLSLSENLKLNILFRLGYPHTAYHLFPQLQRFVDSFVYYKIVEILEELDSLDTQLSELTSKVQVTKLDNLELDYSKTVGFTDKRKRDRITELSNLIGIPISTQPKNNIQYQ